MNIKRVWPPLLAEISSTTKLFISYSNFVLSSSSLSSTAAAGRKTGRLPTFSIVYINYD